MCDNSCGCRIKKKPTSYLQIDNIGYTPPHSYIRRISYVHFGQLANMCTHRKVKYDTLNVRISDGLTSPPATAKTCAPADTQKWRVTSAACSNCAVHITIIAFELCSCVCECLYVLWDGYLWLITLGSFANISQSQQEHVNIYAYWP